MTKVGFFTPLTFQNPTFSEKIIEKVGSALYMGGKQAIVLQGSKEALLVDSQATWKTAVKILILLTTVFPITLALLAINFAYRCCRSYEIINPVKKLENGVAISKEQLQQLVATQPPQFETLSPMKIDSAPHLTFYRALGSPDEKATLTTHYETLLKAQEIYLLEGLECPIPHTKMIEIDQNGSKIPLMVQDLSNYNPYNVIEDLEPAALKQLTTLIAKVGLKQLYYSDVFTAINDKNKIAVVNLAKGNPVEGIFGEKGLITFCYTPAQRAIVLDQAKKLGVHPPEAEKEKFDPSNPQDVEVFRVYKNGEFVTTLKSINQAKRDLTEEIITQLPLKPDRKVTLNTYYEPWNSYDKAGTSQNKGAWLPRILNELKEQGTVQSFKKIGHNYEILA